MKALLENKEDGIKISVSANGNQFTPTDKCLFKKADTRINVDILENMHEVLKEFRIINGAKMWSLDEEWAKFDEIRCFVFKKILETYRYLAEVGAQLQLGGRRKWVVRENEIFFVLVSYGW